MAVTAAALTNVVIERDMPRGYTWAKFRNCWTDDLAEARFMAPELNTRTGDMMPAAFFCALIVYDPDSGYHPRDVKFVGSDAEAMAMHQEDRNILRINAEGHVSTRVIKTPEGDIARSIVFIKEGTVQVLEVCPQAPRPPETMSLEAFVNEKMREITPQAPPQAADALAPSPDAAIQEANMDQAIWPGLVDYDANEELDDAPF